MLLPVIPIKLYAATVWHSRRYRPATSPRTPAQ
jgi:hypothetical protein